MTEADGLKSGVNVALDLEERVRAYLTLAKESVDQLKAQLAILSVSSSSDLEVQHSLFYTEQVKIDLETAEAKLLALTNVLDGWERRL